jgi:hypothetical protein
MIRILSLALTLTALLSAAAPAATIRVVGSPTSSSTIIDILPGQSSVTVPIEITGGELANNFDMGFAIGDGGPVLGGVETIEISGISFAGSIWPGVGFTPSAPSPSLPAQSAVVTGGAITTPAGGTTAASGLLVTFTLDASSVTSARLGEFIPLDLNAGALTFVRDGANVDIPLTIDTTGALHVVPEPSAALLLLVGAALICSLARLRRK